MFTVLTGPLGQWEGTFRGYGRGGSFAAVKMSQNSANIQFAPFRGSRKEMPESPYRAFLRTCIPHETAQPVADTRGPTASKINTALALGDCRKNTGVI